MTTIPIRKDLNARCAEKLSTVSVVYAYFTTSKYIWLFALLAVISVVISSVSQLII